MNFNDTDKLAREELRKQQMIVSELRRELEINTKKVEMKEK